MKSHSEYGERECDGSESPGRSSEQAQNVQHSLLGGPNFGRETLAASFEGNGQNIAEGEFSLQDAFTRIEQLEGVLGAVKIQLQQALDTGQEFKQTPDYQSLEKRLTLVEKERDSLGQENERLKADRFLMCRKVQTLQSSLVSTRRSLAECSRELLKKEKLLEDQRTENERSQRKKKYWGALGGIGRFIPIKGAGLSSKFFLGKYAKDLRKHRHALKVIEASGLFDADWYLRTYLDVADDVKAARHPSLHYLKFGGFEGRNPSFGFDSQWYLDSNVEVKASGMNPLLHYLMKGKQEGRMPMPY